jgi:hypothetical protein
MTKLIKYLNALNIQLFIKFPLNGDDKIFEDHIPTSQDIYYQTSFEKGLFMIGNDYAGIAIEGKKQFLPDLVRSPSVDMGSLFDEARSSFKNISNDKAGSENDTGASGQSFKRVRELPLYGGECSKVSIIVFYPEIRYNVFNQSKAA